MSLVLADPPASLDLPSAKDGTGAATELLGALRVADIPVAAGLTWPAKISFLGERPSTYDWTVELHRRLGQSDAAVGVPDVGAREKKRR